MHKFIKTIICIQMIDQSDYTLEFRILAASWLHETDGSNSAMRIVKQRLRDKYNIEPPQGRYLKVWEEKLFTTGSILDMKRPGRPNERGDHNQLLKDSISIQPTLSTRHRSIDTNIPRTTMMRIMKKDLGYRPWKPVKVQYLSKEDHASRVACCEAILDKYSNPRRMEKLFFSDECAIYAEGRSYNSVFWSKEQPYFWEQVKQYPPTVMVWGAMCADHLIGPFFIEGTVTATSYVNMLQSSFIPALIERGLLYSCHLQQDGAPAHTSHAARQFLNDTFPDRWIGKYGPVAWPARSPDLTSCDNALWGLIKPQIIQQKAQSVEQLKTVVIEAFSNLAHETLNAIHKRTFRRLRTCIDIGGLQVDPYDK